MRQLRTEAQTAEATRGRTERSALTSIMNGAESTPAMSSVLRAAWALASSLRQREHSSMTHGGGGGYLALSVLKKSNWLILELINRLKNGFFNFGNKIKAPPPLGGRFDSLESQGCDCAIGHSSLLFY